MRAAVHGNGSQRVGKFVGDRDSLGSLDDLEWVRHISGARNARQIAVGFDGVRRLAAGEVLQLFRRGPGLVRNLVAFDNALSGRPTDLTRVVLKVPRGGIHRLPDSAEVGFPVGSSPRTRSLGGARKGGSHEHRH